VGGQSLKRAEINPSSTAATISGSKHSQDFHGDAAAALGGRRNASENLVGNFVATRRVVAVSSKATEPSIRSLRDRWVERDPRVCVAATNAAPGDELVTLPAALLLGTFVALQLVE